MAINQIKIYGTSDSAEVPTAVTADWVSLDILGAFKTPEIEGKVVKYWGNAKKNSLEEMKWVYKIELKPKKYSDANYDADDYYFISTLKKPYLWLWVNDYKLGKGTSSFEAVGITSYEVEHDKKMGSKKIKMELECL